MVFGFTKGSWIQDACTITNNLETRQQHVRRKSAPTCQIAAS